MAPPNRGVGICANILRCASRKKVTDVPSSHAGRYRRCLGLVDLTCLGLSTVVGTGTYVAITHISDATSGPSIVLSALVASIAAYLGGLCYVELSLRFPSTGGSAYRCVYATCGELAGFLLGWTMIAEFCLVGACAAKGWSDYVNGLWNGSLVQLLEDHVVDLDGIPSLDHTLDLPAVTLLLSVTIAACIRVKLWSVVNNLLTSLSFLVTVAITFISLVSLDIRNWTADPGFFPDGIHGVFAGAASLHVMFIGFGSLVEVAPEATHFRRSISTATTVLFLVGLSLSFVCAASFTLSAPISSLPSSGPLLGLFSERRLEGMQYFVGFGALCGLTSASYSAIFAGPRLAQRMADDGLLPEPLAVISSKYRTPWPAVVACGMATAVFALVLELKEILAMLSVGTIASSAAVAFVVLVLRFQASPSHPLESDVSFSGLDMSALSLRRRSSAMSESLQLNDMGRPPDLRVEFNESNLVTTTTQIDGPKPEPTRQTERTVLATILAMVFLTIVASLLYTQFLYGYQTPDYVVSSRRNHRKGTEDLLTSESVFHMNVDGEVIPSAIVSNSSTAAYHHPSRRRTSTEYQTSADNQQVLHRAHHDVGMSRDVRSSTYEMRSLIFGRSVEAVLIAAIIGLVIFIARQPKHSPKCSSKVPCIPFLPLASIILHCFLAVLIPPHAWLRFLVWSALGLLIYVFYGWRHSVERLSSDPEAFLSIAPLADSDELFDDDDVDIDAEVDIDLDDCGLILGCPSTPAASARTTRTGIVLGGDHLSSGPDVDGSDEVDGSPCSS